MAKAARFTLNLETSTKIVNALKPRVNIAPRSLPQSVFLCLGATATKDCFASSTGIWLTSPGTGAVTGRVFGCWWTGSVPQGESTGDDNEEEDSQWVIDSTEFLHNDDLREI
ncbi:uncharacterized protein PGTG_03863 [Puccinia graminis f. sp. tritici CRL 75-36-700-3]|uniref:Uncharacterized protein n=1 Tax=Puccinia graminis f. sp. tritici (strain CRL 75-36-700-3 / race SCCL) TaxID=418459 RepID=E3K0T2_PUCGT|nr:uncharacterized protein PGTG_03863 [Puccinia graminis f. sp. tritici CRL 75-36-700-3]EFP77907.1 hypothetical protein PGTG_03863 [Puccinia graminis f. sp. tritici CRL 75-36-700-3]